MRYNNYHKHDHYGNPWFIDTITKPEDYCLRAIELGHDSVFTTNHGVTGNIFEWIDLAKKYNLKLRYGIEAYYTDNRFDKERGKHLIIVARNNEGAMQLNDIMTESHMTGFYYRPRVDKELVLSLNPDNFILTSACVGGLWDMPETLLMLHRKFGKNFFLEVQSHAVEAQITANREIIRFSKESKIPIIHANDSHYIYQDDAKYRTIFQKGKDVFFSEEAENDMILDYPDADMIYQRYEKQGVLTKSEVSEALENTLVFDECEELTYINDEIKLPPVSDAPTEDLRKILREEWKKERINIPKELWKKYTDAIQYELDIIEKTKMENYFLIDYIVARDGQQKYDGRLTNTGRGSAPSFYTTKLLGLTDIDRVSAPITLFPTRFMSVERILGARSLPDIDLNTTDREPFIKATEDLLGKENCAWMLAWKPLQDSLAFRTYCKGLGMDISEYGDIAKELEKYENSPKWKDLIKESKRFVGVIESVSESPCSMLLYNKPVRKEIGLIRTSSDKYCCLLDGYNCDKYKYLKNDYLTVTVWAIIRDVCKLAGIPIPTIREMDSLLDDKTFDIYKEGLTSTINQADSEFATGLVKTYCPKNVSEMSAFVAIIRPGCASLLQDFVHRKPYSTGVEELDAQLTEGNHRMLYQELIMKYLIWLGIPETGSYDIIKKIAKKKFKEAELEELKAKLLRGWIERVGRENGFLETWKVVEQAAKYSFNASHSLSYAYDSLYGAYLKSHYPLEYYTVALNYYSDDSERTLKLTDELKYFGIKLNPIKFRYSQANYSLVKESNSIYKGISAIQYMSAESAEYLYELRNNTYSSFAELLVDVKKKMEGTNKSALNARQIEILIKLDFFEEFGDAKYLLAQYDLFDKYYGRSQFSKKDISSLGIPEETIRKYSGKETEKMFTKVDSMRLLKALSANIQVPRRTLSEKIKAQNEYLGYIDIADPQYSRLAAVLSVDTKYAPKVKLHSLKNGTTMDCKIDRRTFNKTKLQPDDIIRVLATEDRPRSQKDEDGNWVKIPGTKELWITDYQIIKGI